MQNKHKKLKPCLVSSQETEKHLFLILLRPTQGMLTNYRIQYLRDMFTGVEDVNLLDGELTPSLHVVTEKHLTKPANAKNAAFLPLRWCHRRCTQYLTVSVSCSTAKI